MAIEEAIDEARARWICCPMCDKKKCEREADDCDVKNYLKNKIESGVSDDAGGKRMTKEGKDITIDMATQLKLEKKAVEKDLKQNPIDMDMTKALILGLLLGIDKNPDEKDKLREDLVKVFAPEQNTDAYEAGLKDAWECARRISDMPINELDDCFGESVMLLKQLFEKYSPEEAIAKLRVYDAKTERE